MKGTKYNFLLNFEELAQSIWAIDNSKVVYARETITEVVEKIKTRNKHIKIADGSDGIWKPFDNTRVVQSLATRMMNLKSPK